MRGLFHKSRQPKREWPDVRLRAKHIEPILMATRAGARIEDIYKGKRTLSVPHLTVDEFITAMKAAHKKRRGGLPLAYKIVIQGLIRNIFLEYYRFSEEDIKDLWEAVGLKA